MEVRNTPGALTTNGFTRIGHTFTSWNTASNGGGIRYSGGAMYSFGANATLYAQWSVTVATIPGAPTGAKATAGNAQAVVSFTAPASDGGSSISSYAVTATDTTNVRRGGEARTGTRSPLTVTGLTRGDSYTFTVAAKNAVGTGPTSTSSSPVLVELMDGYWLAARDGTVFGLGTAASLGGIKSTSGGPVVGIAGSTDGKGYFVATVDGVVSAFGDVKSHGDLQSKNIHRTDIVAIVATADAGGYWLIGADGEVYNFGDAAFFGDLLHLTNPVQVTDVVGMVPASGDKGYFLLGSDGGVFAFGRVHFYGSLPGIGVKVNDIRGILPSATGTGYVLVGVDGGAFVFGSGVRFYGSLPGRHIKVTNIVGLALTPGDGGYYMAGSNGKVFGFGDGSVFPSPRTLASHLPVAAIAGV